MEKTAINPDVLYVCGDSWTYGSELLDPGCAHADHFHPQHDQYRRDHYWPGLVANMFGLELVDSSMAGAGNDYIMRKSTLDLLKLTQEGRRPFVIISWTQPQRFELPHGREEKLYRSFVGPADINLPPEIAEIWGSWTTDRDDVRRWMQSIILLDAFLKQHNIPWFQTTVFKNMYGLLSGFARDEDFKPYYKELNLNVDLGKHNLENSLEGTLQNWVNVKYGPGLHPLEYGHTILAHYFRKQLEARFTFEAPLGDQKLHS